MYGAAQSQYGSWSCWTAEAAAGSNTNFPRTSPLRFVLVSVQLKSERLILYDSFTRLLWPLAAAANPTPPQPLQSTTPFSRGVCPPLATASHCTAMSSPLGDDGSPLSTLPVHPDEEAASSPAEHIHPSPAIRQLPLSRKKYEDHDVIEIDDDDDDDDEEEDDDATNRADEGDEDDEDQEAAAAAADEEDDDDRDEDDDDEDDDDEVADEDERAEGEEAEGDEYVRRRGPHDEDDNTNDGTDDEEELTDSSGVPRPFHDTALPALRDLQSTADLALLDAAASASTAADSDRMEGGEERSREERDEEDVEEDEAERDAAMPDDDEGDEEMQEAQYQRESQQQTLPDLSEEASAKEDEQKQQQDSAREADDNGSHTRPLVYRNPLLARSPPRKPTSVDELEERKEEPGPSFALVQNLDGPPQPSPFTFIPASSFSSTLVSSPTPSVHKPRAPPSPDLSLNAVSPAAAPSSAPAPTPIPIIIAPPPRRHQPEEPPPASLVEELTSHFGSAPSSALLLRIAQLQVLLDDERLDRQHDAEQYKQLVHSTAAELDMQRRRGADVDKMTVGVAALKKENARLLTLVHQSSLQLDQLRADKTQLDREKREAERRLREKETAQRVSVDRDESNEYRVSTLEEERKLWLQQQAWLESEVSDKSEEVMTVRKQMAVERAEKEAEVARLRSSVALLESQLQTTQGQVALSSTSLSSFSSQLAEADQQHRNNMLILQQELATQTRLADSYSKGKEVEKRRADELKRRLDDMESRLQREATAKEQLRLEAESTATALREQMRALDGQLNERRQQNEQLVQQLLEEREKSLHALPSFVQSVPSRNDAVALPGEQSSSSIDHPITVTQTTTSATLSVGQAELYSRMTSMRDELRREKEEGRRMDALLRQMSKERDDRQAEYEQQQNHYLTLAQQFEGMQQQLADFKRIDEERRANEVRLATQLDSERNARAQLQQECDDLARQLRSVLHGKRRRLPDVDVNGAVVDGLSQESISNDYVEVVDVDELQKQNQRLLALVREQTRKAEERAAQEARLEQSRQAEGASRQELQKAYTQIEELRTERNRMEKRIEQLATGLKLRLRASGGGRLSGGAQSDMIVRSMQASSIDLQLTDGWQQQDELSGRVRELEEREQEWKADTARWDKERQSFEAQLADLNQSFNNYRLETQASLSAVQSTLAGVRQQLSDKSTQLSLAQGELNYVTQKDEVLRKDDERRRVELEAKERKLTELNELLIRHQATLSELRADKSRLEEERRKDQQSYAHFKQENALLKERESRLRDDDSKRKDELQRQRSIIASFTALSTSMDDKDRSERQRMEEERAALQRQLAEVGTQRDEERRRRAEEVAALSRERDDYRGRAELLESQFRDRQTDFTTVSNELAAMKERLKAMDESLAEKRKEVEAMREERERERAKLSGSALTFLNKEEELTLRMRALEDEVKAKESETSELRKERDDVARIAKETELTLQLLQSNTAHFKDEKEEEVRQLRDSKDKLQRRIEQQMAEITNMIKERQTEELQMEKERRDMQQRTKENDAALDEAREELLARRAQDERTDEDRRAVMARLQQMQARYEREVTEHASAIADSTAMRDQLSSATEQLRAREAEVMSVRQELAVLRMQAKQEQAAWLQERDETRATVAEKDKQLELLYVQMETLAVSMRSRQQEEDALSGLLGRAEGEAAKGSEAREAADKAVSDLHEIIRYLRQEKESSELQADRKQQQINRLTVELDEERKKRREAEQREQKERQALQAIQQQQQPSTASTTPAANVASSDLSSLDNQLALLQDSNQLLRLEARRKEERVAELERLLADVQASAAPLQRQIAVLQAEKDAREEELRVLKQENERWQTRNRQLLSRYEQVDPELHKQLLADLDEAKDRLKKAEEERESAHKEREQERQDRQRIQQSMQEAAQRVSQEREEISGRAEKLMAAASFWRNKYSTAAREMEDKQNQWNERSRADSNESQATAQKERERLREAEQQRQEMLDRLTRAMQLLRSTTARVSQVQHEQQAAKEEAQRSEAAWRQQQEELRRQVAAKEQQLRVAEEQKRKAEAERQQVHDERTRMAARIQFFEQLEKREEEKEQKIAAVAHTAQPAATAAAAPHSLSALAALTAPLGTAVTVSKPVTPRTPAARQPAATTARLATQPSTTAPTPTATAAASTPALASPPNTLKRKIIPSPSSTEGQRAKRPAPASDAAATQPTVAVFTISPSSAAAAPTFGFGSIATPTFPSFLPSPDSAALSSVFGSGSASAFPSFTSAAFGSTPSLSMFDSSHHVFGSTFSSSTTGGFSSFAAAAQATSAASLSAFAAASSQPVHVAITDVTAEEGGREESIQQVDDEAAQEGEQHVRVEEPDDEQVALHEGTDDQQMDAADELPPSPRPAAEQADEAAAAEVGDGTATGAADSGDTTNDEQQRIDEEEQTGDGEQQVQEGDTQQEEGVFVEDVTDGEADTGEMVEVRDEVEHADEEHDQPTAEMLNEEDTAQ